MGPITSVLTQVPGCLLASLLLQPYVDYKDFEENPILKSEVTTRSGGAFHVKHFYNSVPPNN